MENSAKELFLQGYNCSQSILYTFGKEYFADSQSALKLASVFGAGVSYRGEMCGAVSGALMAIGLHFGFTDSSAPEDKERSFSMSSKFLEMFQKEYGTIMCNELLDSAINTQEGLEAARNKDLFKTKCPNIVGKAEEILSQLLEASKVEG